MVFAKKKFGQNFLQDSNVIQNIISFLPVKNSDVVVEIGPGRGALTKLLLEKLDKLTVIEIDNDLFAQLKYLPHAQKLIGINEDVLQVDFSQFGEKQYIIGNLPYNISTPLLFHLLSYRHLIQDMIFMLQSEVVNKIIAPANSPNYGRLSVMFQCYCQVERLLEVPPECFNPVPKVTSAVISLQPKKITPAVNFFALEKITAMAFAMRRKTLFNNFKGILAQQDWEHIGIASTMRAQELVIEDFIKIAKYVIKLE